MKKKLLFLALLAAVIGLLAWLEPERFLSLAVLRDELGRLRSLIAAQPVLAAGAYFALFVVVAALSLPGAAILTVAAGALFGLLTGTLLASFASAIGATFAFWTSRYFLRKSVERRFPAMVRRIDRGIAEEGAYYLFAMRLVPLFPFFILNLVMGLTRLRTVSFYWVSQLGMLPVTLVYANAGTQLGRIGSPGDALSPAVVGSLVLLGVFPLLARRLAGALRNRRLYVHYRRPDRFEANLAVIGAGTAGVAAACAAAASRAKVVLIGDDRPETESLERCIALGIEYVQARARIASPWEVTADDRTITARSIAVATGSRPAIPAIPGLDGVPCLTPDSARQIGEPPGRLLVLGGGAAGCELAQSFRRRGSDVTLLEESPRLLATEEEAASVAVEQSLRTDGVRVLTRRLARHCRPARSGGVLEATDLATGTLHEIEFDHLLVATGRTPRTANLGLEETGIALTSEGGIAVNEYLQTSFPNILACGSVIDPGLPIQAGVHQARYCALNALYGRFWRLPVDCRSIPRIVFTHPQVARVGLTESTAADEGLDLKCAAYDLQELDTSIAGDDRQGFVKVLTAERGERILGVTVVGSRAGDMIGRFALAMRRGLDPQKALGTGRTHPIPVGGSTDGGRDGGWWCGSLPRPLSGILTSFRRSLAGLLLRSAERLHRWQRGAGRRADFAGGISMKDGR